MFLFGFMAYSLVGSLYLFQLLIKAGSDGIWCDPSALVVSDVTSPLAKSGMRVAQWLIVWSNLNTADISKERL